MSLKSFSYTGELVNNYCLYNTSPFAGKEDQQKLLIMQISFLELSLM